jgi:hypothetical protein
MSFGLVHRGEPLEPRARARPPLLRHFWSRLMKLAGGRQRGFNDLGALR